jgi:hypothetical protein
MARCPACGTVVGSECSTCRYCGATFLAPAPDDPIEERPVVHNIPFSSSHRKLAGTLSAVVAVALFAAISWWLSVGSLGPDTSHRQWFGVALFLSLPLNAVRAFLRIRRGESAYFGPNISFHTQLPVAQRTGALCFFAILSIAMLGYVQFNVLN